MFDSKNLHHAYIIEGNKGSIIKELKNFLEKELKFSVRGNPDFYLVEYDKFGVNEARELILRQQNMALGERLKIFALAANSITLPAQNALLKIFEEPTAGSHFFLIVPNTERLLPTLKSRAVIERYNDKGVSHRKDAVNFLKSNTMKRLEIVKEKLADLDGENISKINILGFLNELEMELGEKLPQKSESVAELVRMRSYLQDQSSSIKLILEYLALTL